MRIKQTLIFRGLRFAGMNLTGLMFLRASIWRFQVWNFLNQLLKQTSLNMLLHFKRSTSRLHLVRSPPVPLKFSKLIHNPNVFLCSFRGCLLVWSPPPSQWSSKQLVVGVSGDLFQDRGMWMLGQLLDTLHWVSQQHWSILIQTTLKTAQKWPKNTDYFSWYWFELLSLSLNLIWFTYF